MADNPRIEELRRRVQKDPASIAFAQLAEEYRRAGSNEEAIAICRTGLETHPGYLSARVTLGRALIEVSDLDAAEVELGLVLQQAPENLSAVRGLAEIYHRRGDLSQALAFYQEALGLAPHDPDLEQVVNELSRTLSPAPPDLITDGLSFEQATAEFLAALDGAEGDSMMEADPGAPIEPEAPVEAEAAIGPEPFVEPEPLWVPEAAEASMESMEMELPQEVEPASPAAPPPSPVLLGLERFLEEIHAYRQRRAV